MSDQKHAHIMALPNRRDFLYRFSRIGLGSAALAWLSQSKAAQASDSLIPKPPHLPAKAKACIFLYMEGGPSHLDTFDPKPKLRDLHMTEFHRGSKFASKMESGKRYYVQSPFQFKRAGSQGLEINTLWQHFAGCVDDVCFYRGLQAESTDHPTACYHMNTGSWFGGDPAVGAWVTYGLGTENENLPAFVVLPDIMYPQGGSANWSNGFMPAQYQGTAFRAQGSPILDLKPPTGVTRDLQRANLDLLADLNGWHQQHHQWHDVLGARMASYELAYRMQMEIPEVLDIDNEPESTKELYGLNSNETHAFGRRCLLARRLVEKGVRFVQIYSTGWDSHDFIENAHGARIRAVDKPIAGLLKDLKRTGLLDETLVIWGGEFGRSPDNGVRGGAETIGRDHNAKAMSVWMAGGGVKRGAVVGATDELGQNAVECVHPINDYHSTLLRLMGLDDNKLRFFHEGRDKQLSQFGGQVIDELLA